MPMKETMKKVIEEDLKPLLGSINAPTDVFWGKDDTQTPVSDAKTLEEMIPQAHAHVYPGVRHAVHRERAPQIAELIKTQL